MNRIELLEEAKKKIDEINRKTIVLKDKLDQYSEKEINSQANAVLRQLEEIRDELQEKYVHFNRQENKSDNQLTEFEKNIFNSIESFNDAFTEAGSLLKPK